MTRHRAAALHLGASAVLGAMLGALTWFVWYPTPLFRAVGGADVFATLLAVDVMIGPLLTWIVFRPGKASLRMDLTTIIMLQAIAFSYGVYTLFDGRPVYIAALGHRFDLVRANEVDPSDLKAAGKHLPWFGPQWVGTREATDAKERERVLFAADAGADYGNFPQYHQPLAAMRAEILAKASPAAALRALNPGASEAIDRWLADHGHDVDNIVFQGIKSRNEDMTVMIDRHSGDIIGIAPFRPWK